MTYGDDKKGIIVTIRKVGRLSFNASEFLVEGLKYNLLNISQSCDKFNCVSFISNKYNIIYDDSEEVILEGTQKGNTYTMDLIPKSNLITCLSVVKYDPLL